MSSSHTVVELNHQESSSQKLITEIPFDQESKINVPFTETEKTLKKPGKTSTDSVHRLVNQGLVKPIDTSDQTNGEKNKILCSTSDDVSSSMFRSTNPQSTQLVVSHLSNNDDSFHVVPSNKSEVANCSHLPSSNLLLDCDENDMTTYGAYLRSKENMAKLIGLWEEFSLNCVL